MIETTQRNRMLRVLLGIVLVVAGWSLLALGYAVPLNGYNTYVFFAGFASVGGGIFCVFFR